MTQKEKKCFGWFDLHEAPDDSGIYAWYYSVRIGQGEVRQTVCEIQNSRSKAERKQKVEQFLERHLFEVYRQTPLSGEFTGCLNQKFRGVMEHLFVLGDDFKAKVAEKPEILGDIAIMVNRVVPEFVRPIYIGMADNLKVRLKSHKRAISRYRGHSIAAKRIDDSDFEDEVKSFALSVVERGLSPSRLSVYLLPLIGYNEREYNLLEHVLNRTQFPVLGTR